MGKQQSKLKPEVLEELLRVTDFSEPEIQDWYRGFIKECPHNYLTMDEFIKVYATFFPNGDPKKFCQHVFRTFDLNHDGMIDFREFLCALSITSRGNIEQKLRLTFKIYDVDGNGYISQTEMLEIFNAMNKMIGEMMLEDELSTPEKRMEMIFRQMDRNEDGKLSIEEFIQGVRRDPRLLSVLCSDYSNSYLPF